MALAGFGRFLAPLALSIATIVPAHASNNGLEAQFDSVIGTTATPPDFNATYDTALERQIARIADSDKGRIGVAAIDLTTGKQISILGNQRFPLASTSKIAIAATFLEGVDQGRLSLDTRYPMMLSPTREGQVMSARQRVCAAVWPFRNRVSRHCRS